MLIRAACHIHSCWSYDGSWPLTEIAAELSRRRYRIMMTTEHDLGFSEHRRSLHREACAEASTAEIYVLPGIEYSDASNTIHILVWGDVPFLGEGIPTSELLKGVKASNGVAVLAHPSRRNAWKLYDPGWESGLAGIEVWNRKTDGWAPSRHAESLLRSSHVAAFAGMDFHDRRQLFPLAMTFELSETVSEQSILGCLRAQQVRATMFNTPINGRLLNAASIALAAAELVRRSAAWGYRRIR
jgi:predicted metal-dependent phosphoesterase TrpH